MDVTPRQVAVLGALALIPVGIYAATSGHLTTVTAAIGLFNVCLIVGSVMVMFGPSPGGNGHGSAH